jgi:hypothetical protein
VGKRGKIQESSASALQQRPAPILYHGGVPGFWVGDVLTPNNAEHRYVEGCAHCEAQRTGSDLAFDPPTPPDWIYATTDREYARYYASRAVGGTLYRVRLEGDIEPSVEDPFPAWRGRRAIVVGVPERNITLTMAERRRLFVRWGGTEDEFGDMIESLGLRRPSLPVRARETPGGTRP